MKLDPEIMIPPDLRRLLRDIKTVYPNPVNARTHSRKQRRALAKIIRKVGFINPIVVDGNGMILAGHSRHAVALELGMTLIPVIVLSEMTEVQKREAEYKAALAAKKSAEAAAISAENRLHMLGMSQEAVTALAASGEIDPRFVIRAPIDGQVIERDVTLGEMVSPERESLLLLANTSTLWVLADIPEARVSEVVIGAQTWVRAGSINAQPYEGTVAFVSPLVDPATRTAQVRIEVPASALPLKPGMFAQVEIAAADPNGTPQNAVVAIPEQAVQTLEGESVVFVPVVDEQNTFAKRAVTVGKPAGGFVPVYEGLNAGEQVVTAGSFIFKAELGKGSAEHQH